MKTLISAATICLAIFVQGIFSASAQTEVVEGYTFVRGTMGPQVCLGRWIPPRDVAFPGFCDGQLLDVSQLTAVSARLSADRLDQILTSLASIDQKLSVNNDQVKELIEATVSTQTSIEEQVSQVGDLLYETIAARFEELPEEILTNDILKEEITKLKEDILKEVDKNFLKKPTPSTK
jgi:hypothetical protein